MNRGVKWVLLLVLAGLTCIHSQLQGLVHQSWLDSLTYLRSAALLVSGDLGWDKKRYSVLSFISSFSRLTRKCPCVPVFKAENQKARVICNHFSKPPFASCLLMPIGQSKSYGLPKVKICQSQVLPARKSLLLNFQEFGKLVVKHSHYLKFNSYN